MQDYARLIDRIKKLLALASNNPNEAEAKSALNKAYTLMQENNISFDEVLGKGVRKKVTEDNRSNANDKTKPKAEGTYKTKPDEHENKKSNGSAYRANEAERQSQSREKTILDFLWNICIIWCGLIVLFFILALFIGVIIESDTLADTLAYLSRDSFSIFIPFYCVVFLLDKLFGKRK